MIFKRVPRPQIREVFQEIRQRGHDIYIWSTGGSSYAVAAAQFLQVEDLVSGYYNKYELPPIQVDCAVDDQPHLTELFNSYEIAKFNGDPDDKELWNVLRVIEELEREDPPA